MNPTSTTAYEQSGLSSGELEQLTEVARRAAEAGGEQLRQHFGRLEQVREKGRSGDLVTEADHAAEAAVLALLEAETPEIGVLAEESGRRSRPGELEWCVDPLDGTTNYAHSYPLFGTSVGLCWRGQPLLGALAAPGLEQLYWAAPGLGSWCNGSRLAVSSCPSLDQALRIAVEVETLAQMYLQALQLGEPPLLSAAQMAAVHQQFRSLHYGAGA